MLGDRNDNGKNLLTTASVPTYHRGMILTDAVVEDRGYLRALTSSMTPAERCLARRCHRHHVARISSRSLARWMSAEYVIGDIAGVTLEYAPCDCRDPDCVECGLRGCYAGGSCSEECHGNLLT